MRKDWKYIVYVGGAILLFVLVQLASPKQHDWTITFSHDDKNPFGAYALYELMPTVFVKGKVDHHFKTIYEIKDDLNSNQNIFIIASQFSGDKADSDVLLKHVSKGGNVFISAESFKGVFRDTLKFSLRDSYLTEFGSTKRDSTWLQFVGKGVESDERYWFTKSSASMNFDRFDTLNTTAIARNANGDPVTIRVKHGKGSFVLNSTPLAFTNIYLVSANNNEFVSNTLSVLPDRDVSWTEFYHIGRMESGSPLRFILSTEPLAWAYYLSVAGILIFMVFEAKRKQRIIPIIKPLQNTSLEFVSTIGNFYYQHGDHKNIAEKKIAFLLEYIRTNFFLRTNVFDDAFYEALAKKSGRTDDEVRDLFKTIIFVNGSTMISAEQLVLLNQKVENFMGMK